MAQADWLRTFLAVYRSGSVTEGAHQRGLTQPAASQQLAALERASGGPLFARKPSGVEPTQLGRELYAKVAGPLDGLEPVLDGLRAGTGPAPAAPVRLGSSPEYFAAEALPRLA
ncbi:MAG: LysR family transcriptional regulator, partial [Actinomycetota bacterium]